MVPLLFTFRRKYVQCFHFYGNFRFLRKFCNLNLSKVMSVKDFDPFEHSSIFTVSKSSLFSIYEDHGNGSGRKWKHRLPVHATAEVNIILKFCRASTSQEISFLPRCIGPSVAVRVDCGSPFATSPRRVRVSDSNEPPAATCPPTATSPRRLQAPDEIESPTATSPRRLRAANYYEPPTTVSPRRLRAADCDEPPTSSSPRQRRAPDCNESPDRDEPSSVTSSRLRRAPYD